MRKDDFFHRLLREVDKDNPFVINDVASDGGSYCELASNNWENFINETLPSSQVWLMDNAFLQYPLNALVWIDYPRQKIIDHISSIHAKLNSFDLRLIYSHGDSVRQEVKRVLDSRGDEWLNKNLESFVKNPFGSKHKDNPVEGIYSFF
ncbi:MAG: hypothetical protein MK008_08005 [Bdellovibrionales bacterium]|nr:hypothetical protein [Bdellovibrionales bacterium]